MPMIAWGEFRPDVSDIQANYTGAINNVLPRGDGYGPFPSFNTFSEPASAACRGFFRAIKEDGSVQLFMGTADRLLTMDASDYTWDDISKDSSAYSTLSSGDNWQFAQFNNFVIAVQANVPPQVYDLSSSAEFDDLGGSPPQARYIAIVGRFVVLSGLLSEPFRIQWSGLNAPATWDGTNSSDSQDLPDGGVVRGVAGGEYGTIFQDSAIRRMIYAPGSPLIFQIERVAEDIGLYAPYSLLRAGARIFFLSTSGFHQIGPDGAPVPVGRERVDRTFLADMDQGSLRLVQGASDPRSSRVYWAYRSVSAGDNEFFDKLLAYDWMLDRWSIAEFQGEYLASISQPGATLESLDSISSSLDDLGFSLDDVSGASSPEIAAFDELHQLGFFRGEPLEATLETGEQGFNGRRVFVRGIRPITDAPSVFGSLSKRENLFDARTYSTETAVNAQGFCPQRVSTRYSRGKIRIPAGTAWTFAAGIEPDVEPLGMR